MIARDIQGPAESQREGRLKLKKPAALLFGDSHTYAVQRAIEKRQGKGLPVSVTAYRLAKMKAGKQQGDTSLEDFVEIIRRLTPDDLVLSQIGGNQHAVFSTIQHPQRFDFFDPEGRIPVEADVPIIPFRTLANVFEKGIRNGDGKSLAAIRNATKARVVHIVPPPPKKDNAFIQRFHETHFANEGIASLGVTSPGLRLKFWNLQTSLLEKVCAELGVEMMLPPAGAIDTKGFLATDYYANDATHANFAYGELVLREIESRYLSNQSNPAGRP